jgi:hypothetical protein
MRQGYRGEEYTEQAFKLANHDRLTVCASMCTSRRCLFILPLKYNALGAASGAGGGRRTDREGYIVWMVSRSDEEGLRRHGPNMIMRRATACSGLSIGTPLAGAALAQNRPG